MSKKYVRAFIIGTILVVSLWSLNIFVPYFLSFYPNVDIDPSSFGSMFGSVNALFAGLAFAGFLITIWMQNEEIKLQREDLKVAIEEQRLTRIELSKQSKALNEQVILNKENLSFITETYLESKKPFIIVIPDYHHLTSGYSSLLFETKTHSFRIISYEIEDAYRDSIGLEMAGRLQSDLLYSQWIKTSDKKSRGALDDCNYAELRIIIKDEDKSTSSEIAFNIRLQVQDENGVVYNSTIKPRDGVKYQRSGPRIKIEQSSLEQDFLLLNRVKAKN